MRAIARFYYVYCRSLQPIFLILMITNFKYWYRCYCQLNWSYNRYCQIITPSFILLERTERIFKDKGEIKLLNFNWQASTFRYPQLNRNNFRLKENRPEFPIKIEKRTFKWTRLGCRKSILVPGNLRFEPVIVISIRFARFCRIADWKFTERENTQKKNTFNINIKIHWKLFKNITQWMDIFWILLGPILFYTFLCRIFLREYCQTWLDWVSDGKDTK